MRMREQRCRPVSRRPPQRKTENPPPQRRKVLPCVSAGGPAPLPFLRGRLGSLRKRFRLFCSDFRVYAVLTRLKAGLQMVFSNLATPTEPIYRLAPPASFSMSCRRTEDLAPRWILSSGSLALSMAADQPILPLWQQDADSMARDSSHNNQVCNGTTAVLPRRSTEQSAKRRHSKVLTQESCRSNEVLYG